MTIDFNSLDVPFLLSRFHKRTELTNEARMRVPKIDVRHMLPVSSSKTDWKVHN